LGATVRFFQGDGMPTLTQALVDGPSALARLRLPDPERDGRLPLVLEAGARLRARLGASVPITATVVGPLTLAANLRGFEDLVLDWYDRPGFVRELVAFAAAVGRRWGEAILGAGLGVAVSESWIAPPLLSPALYRELALPAERALIAHLAARGQHHTALISGGDTLPILGGLLESGASLLVADYTCDLAAFKSKAAAAGVATRGNLDPKLLQAGPPRAIREAAERLLAIGMPGGRFVVGAGVVPYGTPPEHLLALRDAVEQAGRY
jgi:uroporphyrinogen decarboxylase